MLLTNKSLAMVNVCLLKLTPNCSKQISAGFIKADRQTFLTW